MNNLINFLTSHTPLFYWLQSLWRDEAFSVWISSDSFSDVIARTSGDFNPPFYYLILNIWMKTFGTGEIAARSLSLLFFLALIGVIYFFVKEITKNEIDARIAALVTLLNPMLVYFAFELRMYSLLALLAALSTYFLYKKKQVAYVISATLGLYTQPFMAFLIMAQFVYLLFEKKFRQILINGTAIAVLFLPWVPTILQQFHNSEKMWMWPVDMNLIQAVLGNVFMGYEGTPGNLWPDMKILSLIILVASIYIFRQKMHRKPLRLILLITYLPLFLVLGISFFKPIYVHRYVIYAAVGESLILSFCLSFLLKKQKLLAAALLACLLIFANLKAVDFHRKVNFRQTFAGLRIKPDDVIYAKNPLSWYESWYYGKKLAPVYLYNPERLIPPRYVGSVGMPESVYATDYPPLPARAFVIDEHAQVEIKSN